LSCLSLIFEPPREPIFSDVLVRTLQRMTRCTLASEVTATGTALHAGSRVTMTLSPAPPGQGVVFRRTGSDAGEVRATYDKVAETRLGTVIADGATSIGVVEHLMSAIAGAEIDDLTVTLDGPEPPILDGDALSYLLLIEKAGARERTALRRAIRILRRVEVRQGEALAALEPSDALRFDFEIDFPTPAIGRQFFSFDFSRQSYAREIAPARTFGFMKELETLNKMNLARGASLENTLAIDGDRVVNASLMRFPDEFVRHKILDAVGDMALAGAPLIAKFVGSRSGHATNNALLRALFADDANFEYVDLP
jgi:UDP-3-O-[3-hydroxymyristoyl] N-acetylglucosamine deacetylase